MTRRNIINLFFLMSTLLLCACYYDIEEDLYPSVDCSTIDPSYSNTILTILQKNCLGCHSAEANQGNVNMEGYNNVKKYVDNEGLIGSIKHNSGYSPMPKGGSKLNDCDIAKIDEWIKIGAPNN